MSDQDLNPGGAAAVAEPPEVSDGDLAERMREAARAHHRRDPQADHRAGAGGGGGADQPLRRRQQHHHRGPRTRQDDDRPDAFRSPRPALPADPVHPGPDALGHHRNGHHPGEPGDREAQPGVRSRPGLRQHRAGGRDQPHPPEDPVGPAGGDAGTPGDRPGPHLSAARALLRLRHPEPDRTRGHLPASGGAARPLPVQHHHRLPAGGPGARGRPRDDLGPRAGAGQRPLGRGTPRVPAAGPPGAGVRAGAGVRRRAGAAEPPRGGRRAGLRERAGPVRRQRARRAVLGARREGAGV